MIMMCLLGRSEALVRYLENIRSHISITSEAKRGSNLPLAELLTLTILIFIHDSRKSVIVFTKEENGELITRD